LVINPMKNAWSNAIRMWVPSPASGSSCPLTKLYQADRGRPRARRMLTDMSPTQQQLYDLFDLHRYTGVEQNVGGRSADFGS